MVAGAFVGGEAGVVGAGAVVFASEGVGDAFAGRAAGAVNDSALVSAFFDPSDDLIGRFFLGDDFVGEVGTVETGDEDGGFAELEMFDDINADPFGGSGGERH